MDKVWNLDEKRNVIGRAGELLPEAGDDAVDAAPLVAAVPAFTIVEGTIPLIFHVPHGGLEFPGTDLPRPEPEVLDRELTLMADLHTPLLQRNVARLMKEAGIAPYSFTNNISRILCDPERFDGENEEMNAVGMGVIYSRDHRGQPLYDPPLPTKIAEERTEKYYRPYARTFRALVDAVTSRFGQALIVDLHSYATAALPYELHRGDRRPQICLGYEPFHAPQLLVDAVRGTFAGHGFEVLDNQPFKGSYVPLNRYGTDSATHSLMLEIRKDTYMDESTLEPDGPALDSLGAAVAQAAITALACRARATAHG